MLLKQISVLSSYSAVCRLWLLHFLRLFINQCFIICDWLIFGYNFWTETGFSFGWVKKTFSLSLSSFSNEISKNFSETWSICLLCNLFFYPVSSLRFSFCFTWSTIGLVFIVIGLSLLWISLFYRWRWSNLCLRLWNWSYFRGVWGLLRLLKSSLKSSKSLDLSSLLLTLIISSTLIFTCFDRN